MSVNRKENRQDVHNNTTAATPAHHDNKLTKRQWETLRYKYTAGVEGHNTKKESYKENTLNHTKRTH